MRRMHIKPQVYLIGIGGIGMSALAQWYHKQNVRVYGCDRSHNDVTKGLERAGIAISMSEQVTDLPHSVRMRPSETLVVYSAAVEASHPLLQFFSAAGYTVQKRSEALGHIVNPMYMLAVAGTHGKTTTASMAAHILHRARKEVVAFLGGLVQGYDTNLIVHGALENPVAVVEADEFDRSFLCLRPDVCVVTSTDADHLDVYGHQRAVEEAFEAFVQLVPAEGTVILHRDAAEALAPKVSPTDWAVYAQYALDGAPIHAQQVTMDPEGCTFDYISPSLVIPRLHINLPGLHNVENALAAITACLRAGLSPEVIRQALSTFWGVKRRFERVLTTAHTVLIDDYAHHPAELKALLNAVRGAYPGRHIAIVFQPHLHRRVKDFFEDFGKSLDLADQVFVLQIDAERGGVLPEVSSDLIIDVMQRAVKHSCTQDDWLDQLKRHCPEPDVLLTVGAGKAAALAGIAKSWLLSKHSQC